MMVDRPNRRALKRRLAALLRDDKGATAVEYGLILALVVLGVMTALIGLGGQSQGTWDNLHSKVKAATPN
jgi:pilus assembly protein Flp/PilA